MHLTYVALHEITWCMIVWCTQNAPRCQQFHVAPAILAPYVRHFGRYSETRYKKLVTRVESHASAVGLLESGKQRYIKAISIASCIWSAKTCKTLEINSDGVSEIICRVHGITIFSAFHRNASSCFVRSWNRFFSGGETGSKCKITQTLF